MTLIPAPESLTLFPASLNANSLFPSPAWYVLFEGQPDVFHWCHLLWLSSLHFSLIARAAQVLGSWMVQMAVLGKNYQRDTVVDQEQLYHVWMPYGIQLDVDHWFLRLALGGWQDTVVFSLLTSVVGSRSLILMVQSKTWAMYNLYKIHLLTL